MRLVFCGTPQFAVPTLRAVLAAGHEVALVLTQPDRAVGRGLSLQAPPIKLLAGEYGIPVLQPEKIKNNAELRAALEGGRPEATLVVAYGRIIPPWMLELPRFGTVNLHGSLLPRYRGAAPIQWAIANGESVTGVTTMRLDAGLDTGEMLLRRAVPIGAQETSVELFERLAVIGAELVVETLLGLEEGTLYGEAQDDALASLAPLLRREDGRIDFARSAKANYDRWRGFQPWPGAYTTFRSKKLVVHAMHAAGEVAGLEPGEMLVRDGGLLVVCGGGTLLALDELQMEGKRRLPVGEFLRGYRLTPGERLGG